MKIRKRQRVCALVLAVCLGMVASLPGLPAYAAVPGQGYTYEECNRADATSLQVEIQAIALSVLKESGSSMDVQAIVDRKWNELDAGSVLDREVDAAIIKVKGENAYWERFLSGWSPQKAQILANQVAAYTFAAPAFKAKLGELSGAIAGGLSQEIDAMTARSASSALLCLQAYVGAKYSNTLFLAFQNDIDHTLEAQGFARQQNIEVSPVEVHMKALEGVGVIVATQLTRKIAQALADEIADKLVGSLAGRLLGELGSSFVPLAGWVVGGGLIAWDLVQGSDGALPQIRTALQSEEVKTTVRREIAANIRSGLSEEMQGTAVTLAGTLTTDWQQFCDRYGHLCALTGENAGFKLILNETPLDGIDKLSYLVDILMTSQGEAQLNTAIDNGTLLAMLRLPEPAYALLREGKSPAVVLAWAELAGGDLDKVIKFSIYKNKAPGDLSRQIVAALVAVDDNSVIAKLLALDSGDLQELATLPTADLKGIAAHASLSDLTWLSGYLAQEKPAESLRIAHALAGGSLSLAVLQHPASVQQADPLPPQLLGRQRARRRYRLPSTTWFWSWMGNPFISTVSWWLRSFCCCCC